MRNGYKDGYITQIK